MNGRLQQDRISAIRREYRDDALFLFISDSTLQLLPLMSTLALSPEEIFNECMDICKDISSKGENYIKELDNLWPRLRIEYRRYDRNANPKEATNAVTIILTITAIAVSTSRYDFYGYELPLKIFSNIVDNNKVENNPQSTDISNRLLDSEEAFHEKLDGWFDHFFDKEKELVNDFQTNYIAALAFAMQAKGKYNFLSHTDFVEYVMEEFDEFKNSGISNAKFVGALRDLNQNNANGDFVQKIQNEGDMVDFIRGCYKRPKSESCQKMIKKAQYYFQNL